MRCCIYSHYGNPKLGSVVDVLGAQDLLGSWQALSSLQAWSYLGSLGLCLCLFLVLDKVGSGSRYTHQKLTSACLGFYGAVNCWYLGVLWLAGICLPVPGGLAALGWVSVLVGISAAQARAQHHHDAAGSSRCGNSRGISIWVFASDRFSSQPYCTN